MKYRINLLMFFLLIAFTLNRSFAQKENRVTKETLISKVNVSEMSSNSFTYSNDMRHVAYRINRDKKQIAVIDGVNGNAYDFVSFPVFSSDGKRYAYAARNGSRWFINIDGKETGVDNGTEITSVIFGPQSKNIIYVLKDKNKFSLVSNNLKGLSFDGIDENSIVFSSDGSKIAFTAITGKKQCNVIDGISGMEFDQVGYPILNSDGSHFVYWATSENSAFVIHDNQKSKPYEAVNYITMSNDGQHFAYAITRQGKSIVVYDNNESEPYESVHSLNFSNDSKRFAYGMEKTEEDKEGFRQFAVIDGKQFGPYETVVENSIKFSNDCQSYAYEAEKHDEFYLVRNGIEGKRYGDILQLTTTFSPDNKRIAYVAESNAKRMINFDNSESRTFNDVYAIAFSPDSKRIAYSVRQDDNDLVIIDGDKGNKYNAILGQGEIVFDSPKSFHYLTIKDNNIYLIEESLVQ
jgi:Tol biopolymer transport system component